MTAPDPLAQYMTQTGTGGDQSLDLNQTSEMKAEAEGPPPPILDILSFGQLRDLKPASPLVEGFIYHDTLVQMSGAPGSGKSFVAIGMACAVALRETSWEGHKIRNAGNVLYIAAEGVSGIRHRASAWARLSGHNPDELDQKLFVVRGPAQMGKTTHMDALIDAIRDLDIVLVVFDTRHRCTTGLDENSATDQGQAIDAVEKVRLATGVTAFVIHHTGKSGSTSRGSNSWEGAVWSELLLEKEKGVKRVNITCIKHKEVESGCVHPFDLKPVIVDEADMPNASEQQRTTLVAITADESGLDSGGLNRAEAEVIETLDTIGGQEGLTRVQLRDIIAEHGGSGQSQVYAAVTSLQRSGRIQALSPGKRNCRYTTEAPIPG